MTTKLFAVVLLALALSACDSSSTPETTNNANRNADHPATTASPSSGANEQATPAPATSTVATPQFKAGDKVKVKSNGSSNDATVISVDEKLGKVTIKLSGGEEKTVALSDVTKQ